MKSLIIIDVQKKQDEWVPKEDIQRILPRIEVLLDEARAQEIPVFHITHKPLNSEVYEEVKPEDGELVIKKEKYSAFFETEFEKLLKEKSIDELVIVGMQTDLCAMATAIDAHYRGFKVTIIEDAVAAATAENHAFAIEWMEDNLEANIKTTEEIEWI